MMDASEVIEAFTELQRIAREAAEALQQIVESAKRDMEKQPLFRERKIPPRRAVSRACSPFLRRYWINYRARDKLPCISLKSGGKRKCQRKRSAYRTQCSP